MGYISKKYNIEPHTVVEMVRDGIVDWQIEGLYDFYIFYKELCRTRKTMRDAREETMLHYRMERWTFYRWRNRAIEIFGD